MSSITKVLFYPLKKRFGRRPRAMVNDCPPPTEENGDIDRTFVGYSQDMNITNKTQVACERYKGGGTKCGEAVLVIKGGECDEVLLMKTRNGNITNLSTVN